MTNAGNMMRKPKREREMKIEKERGGECGAARRKSKANNAKEISSPNSN